MTDTTEAPDTAEAEAAEAEAAVLDAAVPDGPMLAPDRQAFVEEFSLMLASAGWQLMDARVLAYLMLTRAPHSSSADIAAGLRASSGSVSMATRRLVELNQIRRHIVPGERSHYFSADTDVWGTWLAGERQYLERERTLLAEGLAIVEASDDPRDDTVRERLRNGRDYFMWVQQYHRRMHDEWEAWKSARDAGTADAVGTDGTVATSGTGGSDV